MTWGYAIYSYVLLPAIAIAYLVFGCWLVVLAIKHGKTVFRRITWVFVILLVLLAIPFADVVVGRAEFSRLCEREAGYKVFRTAPLDAKFFLSSGDPKLEWSDDHRGFQVGGRYLKKYSTERVLAWPRIEKHREFVVDKERGDTLGEIVNFRYAGGWIYNNLPGHHSLKGCSELDYRMFYAKVFSTDKTR